MKCGVAAQHEPENIVLPASVFLLQHLHTIYLQTVAVDVSTRGSLGKCVAIHVGDGLSTLKSLGVKTTLAHAMW